MNTRLLVITVLLQTFICLSLVYSQSAWYKEIPPPGTNYMNLQAIEKSADGNYLITGTVRIGTWTSKVSHVILLKINESGNLIWTKNLDEPNNGERFIPLNYGRDFISLNDGSFIIAGTGSSEVLKKHGEIEYVGFVDDRSIAKYKSNGEFLWETKLGIGDKRPDGYFHSIDVLSQNEIYCSGVFGNQVNVVKFNQNGDVIWDKNIQEIEYDMNIPYSYSALTSIVTSWQGGGVVVVGDSLGSQFFWSISSDGSSVVRHSLPVGVADSDGNPERGTASVIQAHEDGSYIVTGIKVPADTVNEYWQNKFLTSFKEDGTINWHVELSSTAENRERAYKVIKTSDGGYAIVGRYQAIRNSNDYLEVLKVDSKGNLLWAQSAESTYAQARGSSIVETSDGGFLVVGAGRSSAGLILKITADGVFGDELTIVPKRINNSTWSLSQQANYITLSFPQTKHVKNSIVNFYDAQGRDLGKAVFVEGKVRWQIPENVRNTNVYIKMSVENKEYSQRFFIAPSK